MSVDNTYLNAISTAINYSSEKTDRTGTGTLSTHCVSLQYDVRGFNIPLLQSKKLIYTNKVIDSSLFKELKWYLLGSGSNKDLLDMGVKFWSEWATDENHLGPLYGFQWRKWPAMITDFSQLQKVPNYYGIELPTATKEQIQECKAYCKSRLRSNQVLSRYETEWIVVIQTCADDERYTIDPSWLNYDVFAHDMQYMVGYHNIVKNVFVNGNWYLSPEYFNCKHFSKNTSAFVPRDNFEFTPNNLQSDYCLRPRLYHDQFVDLIDNMRCDPFSRRLIINSWNVGMLHDMQLPPCHFTFQLLNKDIDGVTHTSLNLIMRSNDVCLGHPFNIAQYAMLLFVICKLCGTQPDKLYFYGGDFHIYKNHTSLFNEQVNHYNSEDFIETSPVKMLCNHPNPTSINYCRFDFMDLLQIDFDDKDYMCVKRPHFKYPVAV